MKLNKSNIGNYTSFILTGALLAGGAMYAGKCSDYDKLHNRLDSLVKENVSNREEMSELYESNFNELYTLSNRVNHLEDALSSSAGTISLKRSFTESEVDLLSRCAQAEAGVGNYESQKYVVNVILNRVASDEFPDTISEVINQYENGLYQFTTVKNGSINTKAKEDTIDNVKDVLLYNDLPLPSYVLYFHATWDTAFGREYLECQGTSFCY